MAVIHLHFLKVTSAGCWVGAGLEWGQEWIWLVRMLFPPGQNTIERTKLLILRTKVVTVHAEEIGAPVPPAPFKLSRNQQLKGSGGTRLSGPAQLRTSFTLLSPVLPHFSQCSRELQEQDNLEPFLQCWLQLSSESS